MCAYTEGLSDFHFYEIICIQSSVALQKAKAKIRLGHAVGCKPTHQRLSLPVILSLLVIDVPGFNQLNRWTILIPV